MNTIDTPMYSATMVSRLVRLTPTRVRRWLRGYEYIYASRNEENPCLKHKDPVVCRGEASGSSYASFLDLVDLLFVKKFLETGISLQKIRKALVEAATIIGGHHFAQRAFFTSGHDIYLQVKEDGDAILELLSGGQWVIADFIKELSRRIDFDSTSSGIALKYYPRGRNGFIVIDPSISFGNPSIIGKGIATANVYDLYAAENEELNIVCSWFDIRKEEAIAAVDFERQLLLAA
ncbi:MAG: hypothetical protein JW913_12595 [Chitinispirillaceae bacterium]|nr:hypothetical protein [Chitinispirillaceae bacterium]